MSGSISYQDFQSSNGAFANDGGPWKVWRSKVDDVNCGSTQRSWCQDVAYCLECWVFPSSQGTGYTVSLFTNITFNLAEYGGATTLEYEWQYLPWWGSSKSAIGADQSMTSSVGDDLYTDDLKTGNWSQLLGGGGGWDYQPFKHVGSTSLPTDPDKTVGYIPLSINITFPRQNAEYINYFVKKASLKITTPSTPVPSASASSTSLPSNPGDSGSNKVSVGALVGAVIGVAIVVALFFIGILLYRRRQRQNKDAGGLSGPGMGELGPQRDTIGRNPLMAQPYMNAGFQNSTPQFQQPTPGFERQSEPRFQIPSPNTYATNNTRSSVPLININNNTPGAQNVAPPIPADQSSSSAGGGNRRFSAAYTAYTSNDTPPAYIGPNSPPPSQYQSIMSTTIARSSNEGLSSTSGQALALYAQENRALITEELEGKLQRAGYHPADDPDAISEDEWKRDYGVT
ncbi:hypothetical protein FRB91_005480, partial [Serendipita sp. 411]